MQPVRRSRACSLTFCGPRGTDSPEPATGKRRRDAGGAGAIAPASFGAKSPYVLRLQHPAATGSASRRKLQGAAQKQVLITKRRSNTIEVALWNRILEGH